MTTKRELEIENRLLKEMMQGLQPTKTQRIIGRWVSTIDRIYRLIKWCIIIGFVLSLICTFLIIITGIGRGQAY